MSGRTEVVNHSIAACIQGLSDDLSLKSINDRDRMSRSFGLQSARHQGRVIQLVCAEHEPWIELKESRMRCSGLRIQNERRQ